VGGGLVGISTGVVGANVGRGLSRMGVTVTLGVRLGSDCGLWVAVAGKIIRSTLLLTHPCSTSTELLA
jgi:hypothetical protein